MNRDRKRLPLFARILFLDVLSDRRARPILIYAGVVVAIGAGLKSDLLESVLNSRSLQMTLLETGEKLLRIVCF